MSLPKITPNAFVERLIELTLKEQKAEEDESSLLLSNASYPLLERKGLALGNLTSTKISIGLGGRTLVELERPPAFHTSPVFPPHSFRPGDLAVVLDHTAGSNSSKKGKSSTKSSSKQTDHGASLEGVVWKVLETRIVIALGKSSSPGQKVDELGGSGNTAEEPDLIPERIRILKLSNPSTFLRQLASLRLLERQLETGTGGEIKGSLSPLSSVLLGNSKPTESKDSLPLNFIDDQLNQSQREAVHYALCKANEIALLWGPPGTGKTQTLVEIVRQLVSSGKKVLICGGSNLSVDNLLQRLAKSHPTFPPIPLTRIGHPARVLNSLVGHTLDNQSLRTDASEILAGIKQDLEKLNLSLKGTGSSRIRGKERKEMWNEIKELRKEYRKREGGVVKEVLHRAKVVLATTHGAGARVLQNETFDVAIIDEAAQTSEPSCWIPILKSHKLILAGDHLQLPPTIKSLNNAAVKKGEREIALLKTATANGKTKDADLLSRVANPELFLSDSLQLTLFSRLLLLHGPSIRVMLEIQYRFNEVINSFPCHTLYDGKLLPDSSVRNRKLSDLEGVDPDEDLDSPVIFIDTAGTAMYERLASDANSQIDSESKYNENEADLCLKYVNVLVNSKVPPNCIAIISPYNAQVSLLATLVHPQYPEVEIGSVDSYQGREQEVVIISLVRSNDKGEVGFLSDKRRMNVAMTRPKRQLVVIGDSETVSKGSSYLKKWMEWLENHADVRMASLME